MLAETRVARRGCGRGWGVGRRAVFEDDVDGRARTVKAVRLLIGRILNVAVMLADAVDFVVEAPLLVVFCLFGFGLAFAFEGIERTSKPVALSAA